MEGRSIRITKPQIVQRNEDIGQETAKCFRIMEIKCGILGWEVSVNSTRKHKDLWKGVETKIYLKDFKILYNEKERERQRIFIFQTKSYLKKSDFRLNSTPSICVYQSKQTRQYKTPF
jgi:hypothetical protein